MRFVTVPDCDCNQDERYVDGYMPRYFTDRDEAAKFWVLHDYLRVLYWGCHLNGEHVINVLNHGLDPHKLLLEHKKGQKL